MSPRLPRMIWFSIPTSTSTSTAPFRPGPRARMGSQSNRACSLCSSGDTSPALNGGHKQTQHLCKKWRITVKSIRFAFLILLALLTATCASAQNPVVQWNAIAATTIINNAKEPSVASGVWLAYVHLAVFDAVNAIDRRFQPYLFTTNPPAGANKDAAAVAAAHLVLVHYFPSDQASLDAQYASSLAAIPDTPANISAGVTVGEASAQTMIAARVNDGLLANVPYNPPVGPGFWLPTPPAYAPIPLTPWLGQMVPFTMTSAAQFLPD